jgi:uroporphyrin-3 C-methyltransferase
MAGETTGNNQTATSDALANQLTALQKAQESQKAELEGIIKQQATQLDEAKRQQEELAKQLDEVQQKVATISGSDAKTWLLAQADFLVKLAGRKLWSDQDVTTAAALLKSADASLADMNDPSLIRRASRLPTISPASPPFPGGLRRHYPQGEPALEPD